MTMQAQALAERYVALWNLADANARRDEIQALWTSDGAHYVKTREAHGYRELEERVAGAYEKNVQANGNLFRAVPDAQQLRDVVSFHWQMISAGTDQVVATGLEFLHLDRHGKILIDYQFIVA